MTRVLVASYWVMGHYRPFVRVVQQLLAAGHEVMYVSDAPIPALAKLGCETCWLLSAPNPAAVRGQDKAKMVSDPAARLEWQRWVRVGMPESQVEPFRAAIRSFKPAVILADAQMYGAFIAAHHENVPWVSGFTTMNPFLHSFESGVTRDAADTAPDRVALFASHGLTPEFRVWEIMSPTLNVSFITEQLLANGLEVPPNTLLVGPSIPPVLEGEGDDFPWDKLKPDRPIVYVSFGSMNYWQPALIRTVAEAAEPLGVQLVVACGDMADTEHARNLPGDPLVVRVAPQPLLLEKVSVFVSHAGPASLNEACYCGVPMLEVPITSDQPSIAHLVSKIAKIGISIDPQDLAVSNCRQALIDLLAPASDYRKNLVPIKASYRAQDGGKGAADALVRIAMRPA